MLMFHEIVIVSLFTCQISAGPVTQFSIARSPFYNENKPVVVQTGSFIPSFSLCFRDDGGNESSSFKLPTEGSVDDDVEEGRNEDEVPYWIKIKSRDDGLVVEFVDEKDHYLPHYTVPKVRSDSPIHLLSLLYCYMRKSVSCRNL